MEVGFELSEYVMPGLGGWERTGQHARNTAAVLNATDPTYIRVRPLMLTPGTPLYEECVAGKFSPMTPLDMLDELRRLVQRLEITGNICFDHVANVPIFRQDWEGYRLPDEKEHLLSLMDEALGSWRTSDKARSQK